MNKFFILVFLVFNFSANITIACSNKDQLHIVFTSDNNNVSHAQVRAFSKLVFSDALLSGEIHFFSIDVNHAKGTMIFDIGSKEQRKIILEKISDYLKQNQLKSIRISYEKLLEKN